MTAPNLLESSEQAELYLRGSDTLLASWEAYARGATGAAVHRLPGVAAAVFPHEPERAVYNNALLERDLGAGDRSAALDAMEAVYAAAGVARFAAWVHESDEPMRAELERRGYTLDTTTRAMGMDAGRHRPAPPADRRWARRTGPSTWGWTACRPISSVPPTTPPFTCWRPVSMARWSRRRWRTTSATTAGSTTSGRSRRPGGAGWAPR